MKRVLFFGTFDPIHAGHKYAFLKAKSLGDYLTVVVQRDSMIMYTKKRVPHKSEYERLAVVAASPVVDMAMLGDTDSTSYSVLQKISFDILALGYDQTPADPEVISLLEKYHLSHVSIVRLQPFLQETNKSSLLRLA